MSAYYNEFDIYAATWLRNLITAGHIADGVVDTRSIEDVHPSDLAGFTQCHFFAGVGVWSHALRSAGWPDDRPVWTGSCPCQPFSAAGKGAAFDDERHLWPAFHHLIKVGKPECILGEQVASKAVDSWIDLVHADLEAVGYTFGSIPFPSAGVGAPHIRDRNYWVANANGSGKRVGGRDRMHSAGETRALVTQRLGPNGLGHTIGTGLAQRERERERGILGAARGAVKGQAVVGAGVHLIGLAYAHGGHAGTERQQRGGEQRQQPEDSSACGLADSERTGIRRQPSGIDSAQAGAGDREYLHDSVASGDDVRPGPTNGFWRDADWLGCTDGKWRPVMPGSFPLANGAPARVGRLRAYGNAINAEQARIWIETVMECQP